LDIPQMIPNGLLVCFKHCNHELYGNISSALIANLLG
jgi:hypothetical protein